MNNVHPDWHTTDGSETEKVKIAEGDHPLPVEGNPDIPIAGVHVSRQPAAVLGILLVIGLGATFFHSVDNLRGELMAEVTVTITDAGFVPENIQLEEGQGVVWINQTQIPHLIESESLCAQTSSCLETHTIFAGEQARYRLPEGAPPGNYGYRSSTANIEGIIQVGQQTQLPPASFPAAPAQAPAPASSGDPIEDLLENNDDFITVDDLLNSFLGDNVASGDANLDLPLQNNTAPAPAAPIPAPVPEPVPTPAPLPKRTFTPPPGIPVNDITVDWQERNPLSDLQANAQEQLPEKEKKSSKKSKSKKSSKQKFSQPKTGPGIVFAGFGSVCGFLVVLRKYGGKAIG